PVRFCTEPRSLQQASREHERLGALTGKDDEHQIVLAREMERDEVISAWLANHDEVQDSELEYLARDRIETILLADESAIGRFGGWLNGDEPPSVRVASAREEVRQANGKRLLQLWFALEI